MNPNCETTQHMSLYKTILVTLEGTPTDRAIIEHIKPLAQAMQSRVVLLHVATGVPAKYHRHRCGGQGGRGEPGLPGPRPGGVHGGRHPGRGGAGLRRAGQGNRQVGRAERLRPGGDEHARPQVRGRPGARHHRLPGPAQPQRAGPAAPRQVKAPRRRVLVVPLILSGKLHSERHGCSHGRPGRTKLRQERHVAPRHRAGRLCPS